MSLPVIPHAARRLARPLLCALLWHTVLSGVSLASCGDWLADPAMPAGGEHQSTPEHPVPCDGPECRDAPLAPLPPAPAPTLSSDNDRLCQLAAAVLPRHERGARWLAERSLVLPEGLHPRVERPPRA
jgi:hypothetical protein